MQLALQVFDISFTLFVCWEELVSLQKTTKVCIICSMERTEESVEDYICAHINGKNEKSRAHIILERAESNGKS